MLQEFHRSQEVSMSRSTTADLAEAADLRQPSRLLAALVLPIGPLAVAGLRYLLPYFSATTPRETAADVVAAQGRQSAAELSPLRAIFCANAVSRALNGSVGVSNRSARPP